MGLSSAEPKKPAERRGSAGETKKGPRNGGPSQQGGITNQCKTVMLLR